MMGALVGGHASAKVNVAVMFSSWGRVAHRRGRQCTNLEDHPETLKNSEREP